MYLLRAVLLELIKDILIIRLTNKWVTFGNLDSVKNYIDTIHETKNNLEIFSAYEMMASVFLCLLYIGQFLEKDTSILFLLSFLLIFKKMFFVSFIISLIINVFCFYEHGPENFLINSMQKIIIVKTILRI